MAQVDETKKQVLDHNIARNKWAIAAMVAFMLCVASSLLLYVLPPTIPLFLVAVFGIATFVCALKIKDSSKTELLHVLQNPARFEYEKMQEQLTDGFNLYGLDGARLAEPTIESFVMSSDVNRLFITQPLNAVVPEGKFRFEDPSILPYTAYLKDTRDKELSHFAALRPDKSVMGLDSPINLKAFENPEKRPLRFIALSRYAVQVTDDAFNKVIINKKKISDKVVFDGRKCCIGANGELLDFDDATNANQIDMHSLIISKDGYPMFRRGTSEHPLFADKIISSAACSLLPEEAEVNHPIQESMIQSIHNKIRILYHIPEGTKMASSFCGFARIINRGAAPEFYCLTRLDMTKDEILAAHNDPTAEFSDTTLMPSVAGFEDSEDMALCICKGVTNMREVVGKDISISASAMLNVIMDAMADDVMSRKVLQRIGLIPRD